MGLPKVGVLADSVVTGGIVAKRDVCTINVITEEKY